MWYLHEYRALAARAKTDPSASQAFEDAHLSLDFDPAQARAILREHPRLTRGVIGSGRDEGVMFVLPTAGFRVGLKPLVGHLARLPIKEGGMHASALLNKYLEAGARAKLPGHEITLLHGLDLDRQFVVGPGAYLAPYRDAQMTFNLPGNPEEWLTRNTQRLSGSTAAESTGVLVRDLTWGPGVETATDGPGDSSWVACLKVCYRFPGDYEVDLDRFWVDRYVLVALFSIALRTPVVSNSAFVHAAEWIEKIDPNFAAGRFHGSAYLSDVWPRPRQFSQTGAEAFGRLASDWYSYRERDRISLAIRRVAASFARGGGLFGTEDRIVDVAIELEVMYGSFDHSVTRELEERAGALLGAGRDDGGRVSDTVKRFYKTRSDLVHGRKRIEGNPTAYERALEDGRDVACRTLADLFANGPISGWCKLVVPKRTPPA